MAQDLTQNTFLKAWKSILKYSSKRGSFQAFLFAIARNLVIDWSRKRKELSLEVIEEPAIADNSEEAVFRNEKKQMVYRALANLDNQEKEIVILRYFEELTFSEIANVLGKREGAIRVRVNRALKKMKEHLKEEYGN